MSPPDGLDAVYANPKSMFIPIENIPEDAQKESITTISSWRLKGLVFISGAVLMGLEMAGSRVLAIHFGSSIYVWGSIIGIFLAALAGGYYAGGLAADRKPSFLLLNLIALAAGCWLVLLPFYDNFIARGIRSTHLGARTEPLLTTIMLFGGPSVLMGMVSPFSVRLSASGLERIGNVAGGLYALSTVGSIAGTMITAFWLVPLIGTHAILRTLGLCLAAMALIGLSKSRALLAVTAPLVPLVFAVSALSPSPFVRLEAAQQLLLEADSAYHHVQVVDDVHSNTRQLRFNNFTETIVNRQPPHDSDTYTNSFQLARIFKRDLQRIMVIGGGGAIGPRQFVDQDPQTIVDLVEIDPLVVDISRRYFFLPDDSRLKVHVEDGRNFARANTDRYDLVILDAFTVGGQVPFHLTTQEFMHEVRSLLKPDGVFLVNINSAVEGPNSRILRAEYKTALTVFDAVLIFPRPFDTERGKPKLALSRGRNVILIGLAGRNDWTLDSVAGTARSLMKEEKARTPTFLDDALQLYTGRPRTDDVPLLTDDYAPVDTMVF